MEQSSPDNLIVKVAIPVPLRQAFDFIIPKSIIDSGVDVVVGSRVKVPFGSRKLIGIVYQVNCSSDYPINKLKSVIEVIDITPIFDDNLWSVLCWLSDYYLAPIGEVFDAALPSHLRQGKSLSPEKQKAWCLTEFARSADIDSLKRAPLQLAIIKRFMQTPELSPSDFRDDTSSWRQAVSGLVEKNWLAQTTVEHVLPITKTQNNKPQEITFTQQQKSAIESIHSLIDKSVFSSILLHGVTGSGKTEVYFQSIQQTLDKQQQVLLLVPEIGLTPQLVERVSSQFNCAITSIHSGLNDTERHLAWWYARTGQANIIIGTRSAVFTGMADLGLIVVDEEHDGSFKQQDGIRYHARDVAVYRAKQMNVPIILASATPSLESFANAQAKRYHYIELTERATDVAMPDIELFDLNKMPSIDGLSPMMVEAIKHTLANNKQVMLFLNRRGFAPVLYCCDCHWTATCHRCDAHLTQHQRNNRMRCHHCGYESPILKQCGKCNSTDLAQVGDGTQRVEEALESLFPEATILRIDRDSTRRKGELEQKLQQVQSGEADIILGTQLITKGHDFANLQMVGILDADQGLYSTDFRAGEHLFQQILQVAGRAGRRQKKGRVFIQTTFAEHEFFNWVRQHDYNGYAKHILEQRKGALYPPFGHFALLRAESTHQSQALQFLRQAKAQLNPLEGVRVMDAIPAPMAKRAGKFRAQLLITADKRSVLHATLAFWLQQPMRAKVRWSLDIDPIDLF